MNNIEIIEYQVALFSTKFDLSDHTKFIESVKTALNLENTTETVMPPTGQQPSLVPRIFLYSDDIEVQASDLRINLIYKKTTETDIDDSKFNTIFTKFFNSSYFKALKFSRVGYAVMYVRTGVTYGDFAKDLFGENWNNEVEKFNSTVDYLYSGSGQPEQKDSYLRIVLATAINLENKPGILGQFDVSSRDNDGLNISINDVSSKINSLKNATFVKNKIKLFMN